MMMHELVLVLLKATSESKEGVIQYFAEVIRINENRAKMQVCYSFIIISLL